VSAAEVVARPHRSARIATIAAAVVVVAFVICGLVLPDGTNGAHVNTADRFGLAGVGVIVALGILGATRPRLRANAGGLDVRPFFGGWRHVDWDLVLAVEFPSKVRFARLVLPGEELIPLYAVQRGDGERSVEVMQGLRALFVESQAPAGDPS